MLVSVNLEAVVVDPGNDDYLEAAWQLKERIRRREHVLKQRREFFADSYRRARVYMLLFEEEVIAFAAVRPDGYVLFLAVAPEFRDQGLGRRLIARVAEEHDAVTCHARATNDSAMAFYRSVGFEVERRIKNYYEDGGDAFFLRLGTDGGLTDRLSDLLR